MIVSTFNSRQINWISLLEVVLLILVVGPDLPNTSLVTTGMTWAQWSLSLVPAGALFVLWELGKLIARREQGGAVAEAGRPAEKTPPTPTAEDHAAAGVPQGSRAGRPATQETRVLRTTWGRQVLSSCRQSRQSVSRRSRCTPDATVS